MKQLIQDVELGHANFTTVLVYDVSRWGRFQDVDESAYYEFICKRAGITVEYCAEQFENDGSPLSAIVKGIKRAMAGEYSRELSVKVFAGQSRIVKLGYRVGGQAGYGLRRLPVDAGGNLRGELALGQEKNIKTDRIVLVHGPHQEVVTVGWIFSQFVHARKTEFQISQMLNERGFPNGNGTPWSRHGIKAILRNEKYIGNNVWNRTSFKLQRRLVSNDPNSWLRAEGAFQPIVDTATFDAAQAIYLERTSHPIIGRPRLYANEEMLGRLRCLLAKFSYLNHTLINKNPEVPSACAYTTRFGSLTAAYRLIGYTKPQKRRRIRSHQTTHLTDAEMLALLRRLLHERGNLSRSIIDESKFVPSRTAYASRFGSLRRAYKLIGFKPTRFRHLSPRPYGLTEHELLEALREALRRHGHISQEIIDSDTTLPSYHTYQAHFGGLKQAYKKIGFTANARRNSISWRRPQRLTS